MSHHRVLVADDHPDTADTLAEVLRLFGHDVRSVYDGAQALETVEQFEPDVVILDINMPLADGYQVARALRARQDGRQFIVAMTGASARETEAKALQAGFDVHLVKPVSLDTITKLLERI